MSAAWNFILSGTAIVIVFFESINRVAVLSRELDMLLIEIDCMLITILVWLFLNLSEKREQYSENS